MYLNSSHIRNLSPSSSCLYPRKKQVEDRVNGGVKTIVYPCGKCWNCIQSFRDSWRIRLYETMCASFSSKLGGFIYDTLTVCNDSLPYLVYECNVDSGEVNASLPCFDFKDMGRCAEIVDHYGGRVPFLDKHTVQAWFKNGREKYNYFYRKDIAAGRRSRCPIRIFGALEYGPKWGRPHVHLCAFGVSRSDYQRFWGKPWRKSMGFNKCKWIDRNTTYKGRTFTTTEHASRISQYISKYLLKGSHEIDLVKYGLVPSAWRIVSHGIGVEYLDNSRFEPFKDWRFQLACHSSADNKLVPGFPEAVAREYLDTIRYLGERYMENLKTYLQNGYKFPLPRYYLMRLLGGFRKSIPYDTILAIISEDACQRYYQKVVQYASDCHFCPGRSLAEVSEYLDKHPRTFNMVLYRYFLFEKNQKVRRAEWNSLKTLNTKKRLFARQTNGDLGLLL